MTVNRAAAILMATAVAAGGTTYAAASDSKPTVKKASSKRGPRGPRGPRGFRGFKGPQGQQGLQGAAGQFSAANVIRVDGPTATMCADGGGACSVGSSTAQCPAGSVALGGGWNGESSPPVNTTVGYNYANSTSWVVIMSNRASISATFHAIATCATAGGGSGKAIARKADVATVRAQVAAMRAAKAKP